MSDNPTKPKRLTVGSLFAGIGGFDLGFERAGFETVWQVEIDEYCRRVLERHFPRAERFGDIRDCGAHNLKPVDVICGGFPCQPVSLAGSRLAQSDERWLWPQFARVVCEVRPQFAVVENVPGLLSAGLGDVLGDLAELGYDAEWQSISAAAFDAPHIRDRVWVVAYTNEQQYESGSSADQREATSNLSPDAESDLRRTSRNDRPKASDRSRSSLANATSFGLQRQWAGREQVAYTHGRARIFVRGSGYAGEWAAEPALGRVANGIPNRVGQLRGLGNSIVPQIAQWIAERIKESLTLEVTTEHG